MSQASAIIKKPMRYEKINFFESPHIQHFNFNNMQYPKYRDLDDDLRIYQQCPFPNQLSANQNLEVNLIPNINNFLTSSNPENLQNISLNQSQQKSVKMDQEQPQFDSLYGINQKLQYSQQQPLITPVTPIKKPRGGDYNNTTQNKKRLTQQYSQTPDAHFYETGLKKLAKKAFNFVCKRKKTTYKEVANNLINDLNSMGIHKIGEMNIKRRVYDALNVLLALGLIKRNGNKIIGKKLENEQIFLQNNLQKRKQNKTEQNLQNQLQKLQKQYHERLEIFQQKQKITKTIKQKINKMASLRSRNILIQNSCKNVSHSTIIEQSQKIYLPFVGICMGQDKSQNVLSVRKKGNGQFRITKINSKYVTCSFSCQQNINLFGDIDLIDYLKINPSSIALFRLNKKLQQKQKRTDAYF